MTAPPDKICETCGRAFSWRARWARNWESVRYCSKACKGGPGAEGRRLEAAILELLGQRRAGASVCPSEVARRCYAGDAWRGHMEAVRQAARRLAHAGRLQITQGGREVDPCTFRGAIRLRLPGDAGPASRRPSGNRDAG